MHGLGPGPRTVWTDESDRKDVLDGFDFQATTDDGEEKSRAGGAGEARAEAAEEARSRRRAQCRSGRRAGRDVPEASGSSGTPGTPGTPALVRSGTGAPSAAAGTRPTADNPAMPEPDRLRALLAAGIALPSELSLDAHSIRERSSP
jgi:hypothetical protein